MSQVSKKSKDKAQKSISKVESKRSSKKTISKSPATKKRINTTPKKNSDLPLKEDIDENKPEDVSKDKDEEEQCDDEEDEIDELESASEMRNAEIKLTSHDIKTGKVYFKYNFGGKAQKKKEMELFDVDEIENLVNDYLKDYSVSKIATGFILKRLKEKRR